jgi:signal transduction histidine kinase
MRLYSRLKKWVGTPAVFSAVFYKKFFRSATFRLAGLYLLLFVFSVALLVSLLFFQVRKTLENEARMQISNEVNLLLFEYREDGLGELLEETEERIEKSRSRDRLIYMVQNPTGRVIFDRVPAVDPPFGWRLFRGGTAELFFFEQLDNGYILGIGKDMSALTATERAMGRTLLWTFVVILLLGAVGGTWLSRRTLRQLDSITHTAQAVGAGRLTQRIPLRDTGDELDELGRTLNLMFDRIENLVANVRQVSTGIAHDLRTPLARLRNRLESLKTDKKSITDEALTGAIAEVDGILQTFTSLLRLAELETGVLRAGFVAVDMTALVNQVVEVYQPIAEDMGKILRCGPLDRDIFIRGDKNLVQQLLVNLLENANQHAGHHSEVVVSLTRSHREIVLQVADNGVGIPAHERDRVIKPFQRRDESSGTGLGLALVHSIAQLHDAELRLLDNQPGLRCEIRFSE